MNRDERLALDGVVGEPVLFYDHREHGWGIFSNFSRHPVVLHDPFTGEPRTYETSEHRYQAMKAPSQRCHAEIAESRGPGASKQAGGPRSQIPGMVLRDGWGSDYGDLCWYVMFEVVLAKAIQHPAMLEALRRTGDRHIYEDSPTDDIWGWRFQGDHRGKNLLGRCLMEVREVLA